MNQPRYSQSLLVLFLWGLLLFEECHSLLVTTTTTRRRQLSPVVSGVAGIQNHHPDAIVTGRVVPQFQHPAYTSIRHHRTSSTRTSFTTHLYSTTPGTSATVPTDAEESSLSPSSTKTTSRTKDFVDTVGLWVTEKVLPTSASDDVDVNDEDRVLRASVIVGLITGLLGYTYSKTLGMTHSLVWKKLPLFLLSKLGTISPNLFIPAVTTTGALLIALIASNLQTKPFAVYDFVTKFSSKQSPPKTTMPSSRVHLIPLMTLCLLTSTFGFSVGPEAPMVCIGGLVGASLARYFFKNGRKEDQVTSQRHQETLAYAGAAGAITASLGIPIAGSIFALELTQQTTALAKPANRILSPTIIASIAALTLTRGILNPKMAVGGHFSYGTIGYCSGRSMILTSMTCGIGGAILGTIFHKMVSFLKHWFWSTTTMTTTTAVTTEDGRKKKTEGKKWKRQFLVKGCIGLLVGIVATRYPQTLFWGEGSLQMMIDGQQTAFSATKHGLIAPLTAAAVVNPSIIYSNGFAALQIAVIKLLSIALACAGQFPGGIIFPLFAAAAPFAHAMTSLIGAASASVVPVAVMSLMASLQASVTRTPLATALILSLTASASTALSVMLPACLISSYVGVYVARILSRNSYFTYKD